MRCENKGTNQEKSCGDCNGLIEILDPGVEREAAKRGERDNEK